MHRDVLESRAYPDIMYECSRITASKSGDNLYWASLSGELTLHGVTRALVVPARITLGDDQLRASGELSVRQTDYRVKLVSAAGGTIKVKDELKLAFDIVARRSV
jgi:polyisoprenoid-binding protein YceI